MIKRLFRRRPKGLRFLNGIPRVLISEQNAVEVTRQVRSTKMDVFNIRSWADARAFLAVAIPGVAVILVSAGYLTKDVAGLWVALALVVVHASVASFNSADGFRKLLYPLLVAAGGLLVRYGYTTNEAWALWTGLAPILFGPAVAAANINTTPSAGGAVVDR